MTATPANRRRLRQSASQVKPSAMASSPHGGMCGARIVAPGNAAVARASHSTASFPQPITISAGRSMPSGMRARPTIPAGMTTAPVSGTAMRFDRAK